MAACSSPRKLPVIACSTRAANTSGKLGQIAIKERACGNHNRAEAPDRDALRPDSIKQRTAG